jgi:hypothetical protein
MKTKTLLLLLTVSLMTSLSACVDDENDQGVICTEEFRSTILIVPGDPLTESYTVRLSNSDTIRNSGNSDLRTGNYIVLDDTYQPKLEDQQDTFRFIGKRGIEVVVREDYVFKADQCHITKVSGKSEL